MFIVEKNGKYYAFYGFAGLPGREHWGIYWRDASPYNYPDAVRIAGFLDGNVICAEFAKANCSF